MTPVAQWALWSVAPCPMEALAWLQGTWLYPWGGASTGVKKLNSTEAFQLMS